VNREHALTKIYYFSGTGNTLWSAKKIAEIMGNWELINIGTEAYKDKIVVEADTVVLLFPSYAYGMPLIVRRFVKNAVFKTAYVAAFVTFGTSPGGTMTGLSRILKRKKIDAVYFGQIPAVENYIALFGSPKLKITEKRLAMQIGETEAAARCIMERRTNRVNPFRPFSVFVWLLFFLGAKIFYRFYRISAECNGCGICEKICPVSAITLRNGKPEYSKKCQHCNGCLNWCPRKAISFGRLNAKLERYHHPEITVTDMAKFYYYPPPRIPT
jgi:ferredoxin/flavodoxin